MVWWIIFWCCAVIIASSAFPLWRVFINPGPKLGDLRVVEIYKNNGECIYWVQEWSGTSGGRRYFEYWASTHATPFTDAVEARKFMEERNGQREHSRTVVDKAFAGSS